MHIIMYTNIFFIYSNVSTSNFMRYINRINLLVVKMNHDSKERTNTFVQYHDFYHNQIISKTQLWRFVHFEI